MTPYREDARRLCAQMTLEEKLSQLLNAAPAIERLGIPAYNWWNEGLHGVARAGTATVFPQAIGLAASFDDGLIRRIADVIALEARAKYNEFDAEGDHGIYKGLTYWSPNINLFRDPRWGRGHETYGEDPYLTARMGTAFVKGLQGEDEALYKVDATLKHFAVHSGPEGVRHGFDATVSPKDLYGAYLWAFAYCIRHAHPAAVMGAYNSINGEPCCGSRHLLQDVLRGELGFDGYVVSDCGAICDLADYHHAANGRTEAAALALNSGVELNCGQAYGHLLAALEQGLITEETVTHAVEMLFETRFRLGMFRPKEERPLADAGYECVACPQHLALAREAAEQSVVLLQNDGILPLSPTTARIAVVGPNADTRDVLIGNYNGTPSAYATFLQAAQQTFSNSRIFYSRGCDIMRGDLPAYVENPFSEAVLLAKKSDVVLFCTGLQPAYEGEEGDAFNSDAGGDKFGVALPKAQRDLMQALLDTGTPVVAINFSGSAISFEPLTSRLAAILQVWYPGEQGTLAICRILNGTCSPSGKLPVTFYRRDEDLPDFADYSMDRRTYRNLDTPPLFEFGFGLSYADIQVTAAEILGMSPEEGLLHTRVTLESRSAIDAREVIQVYARRQDSTEVRNHRLVGFCKVAVPAHSTQEHRLDIELEALYPFDDDGKPITGGGRYTLWFGTHQPTDLSTRQSKTSCLRLEWELS